jgi:hypothetical protein
MVDAMLSDAPRFEAHSQKIQDTLNEWREAAPELEALIDASPALHEARPLAGDLSALGTSGLEALSYLSRGVAPGDAWRDAKLAALEQVARPKAALEFPVVSSVRRLVVAAAESPRLRQMTPAEWKEHVKTLSAPPAKPPRQ